MSSKDPPAQDDPTTPAADAPGYGPTPAPDAGRGEPNPDPGAPGDRPAREPDAPEDLKQRLQRATKAAERLINEAGKPPPAGWQTTETQEPAANGRELELLAQLIRSVRELLPAELERRLAEALRELLLALRALIDFYLERLEARERPDDEARDIPIS